MARLEGDDLVLGPRVVAVRLRHLDVDAPSRIVTDKLALFGPADEVAERFKPQSRGVRCQRVEQRDDEVLRQRRQQPITVLLAEALEHGPTLCRRATGQTPKRLRLVELGERSRHRSRLAARAGADGNRRGGERLLIGRHELGRTDNAGEGNARHAAAPEVVIAAEALHVFEMQLGHRPLVVGVVAFSLAVSWSHALAPAVVCVASVSAALSP